ncbi:MAG: DUF2182 domain-containing protein [Steroidobacteraceae bacterium]
MWAVMMTAMMLPTATPLILLYAAAARRNAEAGSPRVACTRSPRGTFWCGRSSAYWQRHCSAFSHRRSC